MVSQTTKTINNFSPNMLKTFEECQTKFFLKYVEKLSVPQETKFFEKGKKIHALASYYLKGENIEKMEKTLNPDEKTTWETLKSSKYFELKPLETEYTLSCKIANYWIGGRLDAFMQDKENYYILDYKTGNIPTDAEEDFQTIVYLLCADKFLKHKKIDYKSLQFIYLGLKKAQQETKSPSGDGLNIEKAIPLGENTKKHYEEKIAATCQKIDLAMNSTVFSKNKEKCKNCEYNKICNS